ncbi:site-2 protease family protein [bacterium]|nr:site-2 protease family protein [bacterium]
MTLLVFIIALSFIVIIHELGHFLIAKRNGVLVEEFGLGYPPRIFGKKIGETIYSLNWLPLGGFVKILGEVEEQKVPPKLKKRALTSQSVAVRAAVAVGGVLMNFLLAIFIFAVVYSIMGIPQKTDKVKIIAVSSNSPAEKVGLKKGDWVVGFWQKGEWKRIEATEQLVKITKEHGGEEIKLLLGREKGESCPEWVRAPACSVVTVKPRANPPPGEGALGVVISQVEIIKPPWWKRPFLGIKEGLKEAFFWGKAIGRELIFTVWGLFQGKKPTGVAGPVGIYQATSEIKKQSGFMAVFHFFGILSVNFAVVNLFPFPALDGSRLIFLGWELITKKKPHPRVEAMVYKIGMIILLALFFVITWGDIKRLKQGF